LASSARSTNRSTPAASFMARTGRRSRAPASTSTAPIAFTRFRPMTSPPSTTPARSTSLTIPAT